MESSIGDSVDLVWNKGIAALCDWRIPDEFVSGRYSEVASQSGALFTPQSPDDLVADPEVFSDIQDGDLVWVRLAWLRSFVKQVLPLISSDFVLVTGDSDTSVPAEVDLANEIVNHSKVIHWHTQNFDGSAHRDRISPIPIGIDFHTLGARAAWGEKQTPPIEQEQEIKATLKDLPILNDRIPKLYADFGFQPRWDGSLMDRKRFLKNIPSNLLINQREVFERSEMWRRRGEYAFVLSPHGYGLDCHRTWEALALGHIVVTSSSPLDPLYTGLPVITIQNWSEVTRGNLERWLSLYGNQDTSALPQLTSRYWADGMRSSIRGNTFLDIHQSYPMPRRLGHSLEGLWARFVRRAKVTLASRGR